MRRIVLLFVSLLVVSATIVIASGANTALADGGRRGGRHDRTIPPAVLRVLGVATVEEGVTETPGFKPDGFQGDVSGAVRQASGLDQTLDLGRATDFTTATAAPAAYTYCRSRDAWRSGKSAVGLRLWTLHHTTYYCHRGGKLVGTPISWIWPGKTAPGWEYKGQINARGYWLRYPYSYYVFRQGKFGLCLKWIGCLQHVYPWISWTIYGTGASGYRMGG